MHKCPKCGREFPWGLSAADGKCFPCRWPQHWTPDDEAAYKLTLERAKPAPKPKA